MQTSLNLDSLTVDANGRVSFSGLGTGIDLQGAVDGIMQAKRIPIDRIEQRISDNQLKVAAFQDLNTLTLALKSAVAQLRGAVSFDGSSDIFEAKQAFATASRTDSQAPSDAAALIGISIAHAAQATSHTIEVLQLATAHKVASDSIGGALTDAQGLSGTFEINGRAVTVDAADDLLTIRDRINAVNSGADASGVSASIVSISATEHVLILTAAETGTDAAISAADTSGNVLESLGVLAGGSFKNELQAAQNAELEVDGLASTIERQSNTIDDIFAGVTLSLFKAEVGTTVKIDVERDLNQVKQAIVDVVEAYNALRTFINQQALTDVPEDAETGAGILAGSSALSAIRARLSAAIGAAVDGAAPPLSVLAEIGITFQGAGRTGDPLSTNTLKIDETKLDEALLNQTDAVRGLFAFALSSSSPDAVLVGFDGKTSYSAAGYTLNVAYAGGAIVSANIDGPADGSDDGSVVVNGKVLKVVAGGAEGLQLLYTGTGAASGIRLDLSVGVGAKLYGAADALVDETSGLIANEIDALEGQNELGQERIERLQERLDRERERLLERFVAMETALTTMNRLLESLRQQIELGLQQRPALRRAARNQEFSRRRIRPEPRLRRRSTRPARGSARRTMRSMQRAMSAYGQAAATLAPARQIVLLYDGAMQRIKEARRALEQGRVNERYIAVAKASAIVEALQACLDHERGGEIARNLDRIYTYIAFRLQRINLYGDLAVCDELVLRLGELRASWAQVAGLTPVEAGAPTPAEPARAPSPGTALTI